jgi:GrpB protein
MLRFCDHLRRDDADRWLYQRTKRELAVRRWTCTQNYADATTPVVEEIVGWALRKGSSATGSIVETVSAAITSSVKAPLWGT